MRSPLHFFLARHGSSKSALVVALLAWGIPAALGASAAEASPGAEPDDGWLDVSDFLDKKHGFLPLVVPVTDPAVGYGAAVGLAFIDQPLGAAASKHQRPDVTVVGGLATANGTWGLLGADYRHWLDDRVQTLAALVYASANVDFYGIGDDTQLRDDPLRYNLEPKAVALQGKVRLGASQLWVGLAYSLADAHVAFEAPAGTPGLPAFDEDTDIGGLLPSLTFDSRDNLFTPTRGAYLDGTVGVFDDWLGSDVAFERVRVIGMQFFPTGRRVYFGYRGELAATSNDTPFYLEPFLSLRGAPILRYQGEAIGQLEVELRWQFWKRLSAVGFAGYGAAWNDLEDFNDTRTILTGGTGMRYEIARRHGIHVGFDVAWGPDDTALYIQFGSAWARP